jgi:hypothetical protein
MMFSLKKNLCHTPVNGLKKKKELAMSSAGKNMKLLKPSHIADRYAKWVDFFLKHRIKLLYNFVGIDTKPGVWQEGMLCVQKANILLTLYMDVKLCFFFLSLF